AKATGPSGSKGAANVRFITLSDLAEDLGGVGCRRGGGFKATRSSLGAAARAALASRPGFLAAVAEDPSTEEEVVAVYEDLRQLGEGAFDLLGRRGRKQSDLAEICQTMRAHLERRCFDDADLFEGAIAALDEAGLAGDFGQNLIVQLPERARPAERRLIAALAKRSDLVVHLGVLGDESADAPIRSIGRALVAEGLSDVSVLPSPKDDGLGPDEPVFVAERIEARDAESEVLAAARLVLDSIERGIPADRIAVLYSSPSTYHQLVADVIDSAGITWSGPSATRVIETATACTLTGLVGLAISGLERDALLAWLRSAPLRDAHGELLPVGSFELVSRRAGVVGGDAAVWRRHLDTFAAELRRGHEEEPEEMDLLPPSERSRRDRRLSGLDACRSLVSFINDLEVRLSDLRSARTWSSLVEVSRSALDSYLGGSFERASRSAFSGADDVVDQVLVELEVLDEVGERADLDTFSRAVDSALERAFAYEGTLAKGIIVDDLAHGIGLDLDLVIVLGAVEGELPGRARSSPLLSASDREAIGLEASTAKAVVERDRRRLLGAMCGTGRVVLCLRERDAADGRARVRSRFVGDAGRVSLAPSAVGALRLVSTGQAVAIDRVELVTATLAALRAEPGGSKKSYLVKDSASLAASVAVHAARRAHAFDRFSGHVPDGLAFVETVRAGLSPTTLETYAECPFRYFLSRELSLEIVEAPEQRLNIDARDRGSIAHAILERFVEEIIAATTSAGDGRAGSKERLEEIADDVFARYERLGLTGARSLWRRERRKLLRVLNEERERDEIRRRGGDSIPVAVEWVFGGDSDTSVSIELGERELVFRGKVDRIDRRADGSFAVIDYKTGRSRRYTGLLEDPVDRGRHLQLVVYALAARAGIAMGDPAAAVRAAYRFIEEGKDIPIDFVECTVDRARQVLDVIVDGIESGRFPFNPGPRNQHMFDNCRFCDFDRLCPSDRDAFWESARTSGELSRFVSLVEPEEIDA
ncbi:MAG TPA: PD-(D/E)XK nuclease family protein, partial [Acidimicrobiales bacterium]|nr:PD-(D/E)XK nuclease family protein [Acidimicrobiales bacterium]